MGRPPDALRAILNSKEEYQNRYLRAKRIAQQVFLFGDDSLIPKTNTPDPGGTFVEANLPLRKGVTPYLYNNDYKKRGEAAFEQILMDQLRATSSSEPSVTLNPLESPPDRLTISRLNDLFGHCLFREQIELTHPDQEQIRTFLKSVAPYIALTRNGRYERMLDHSVGERLVLNSLYETMIKKDAAEV